MKLKVYSMIISLGLMGSLGWQATAENSSSFGDPHATLTKDLLDRIDTGPEKRLVSGDSLADRTTAQIKDQIKDQPDRVNTGTEKRPASGNSLADRTTAQIKDQPDRVDTGTEKRPASGDSLADRTTAQIKDQIKDQPDRVDTGTEKRPSFGEPLAGLTPDQLERFEDGKVDFEEEEEREDGLGPVFNAVSCAACHKNPTVGGDSDITEIRFGTTMEKNGKTTFDPMEYLGGTLLQSNGIGEVGKGCNFLAEKVPKDAKFVELRKTTSLLGLGLVDAVPDSTFHNLARLQKVLSPKTAGRPSMVKNLSTGKNAVGKFGWKGQNPTLFQFGADAYLNEMGITSPLFPDENCPQGDCELLTKCLESTGAPDDDGSGVEAFADFMMFLAPPPRGAITPQVQIGELVFTKIGCANCHVSTLKTGSSPIKALDQKELHPYSDFLLHDVGTGDGIVQGDAQGNELRTAPLWGLRVRKTFLHDASEDTVEGAILAHGRQGQDAREAFKDLSDRERQALVAFLKSL